MEITLSLEQLNNVAEIDIVYRSKPGCKMSERPQIDSSHTAYEIFAHYWNRDKIELVEEFKVLFLNRANRVKQLLTISSGGLSSTVADPRIILAAALKVGACAIVLGHNHPSGNLKPSKADIDLTVKIRDAALLHDITVLDHIILNHENYLSFADEGL